MTKEKYQRYPRHHLRYDVLIEELDKMAIRHANDADLGKALRDLLTETPKPEEK